MNWISYLREQCQISVSRLEVLTGGCVGEVYRAKGTDRTYVVKVDAQQKGHLLLEGKMLQYLKEHSSLPVPEVFHTSASCLVMELIEGHTGATGPAEEDAALQLAALHQHTERHFGFEYDTCIGGLHQPNTKSTSWLSFFGEQRLLYMGQEAVHCDHLSASIFGAVEKLVSNLNRFIQEPPAPSLIHGDVWSGNLLSSGQTVHGFIDPAIYFADPEIELAFITLFSTFGERFFRVYHEHIGIRDGFFEERKDIYNLYPLLVHTVLFGGSYARQVQSTLRKYGFC